MGYRSRMMRWNARVRPFRLVRQGAAYALTASLTFAAPVFAGPNQATVVHGDVTFTYNGDHTIVHASDGSIINYISFDILPWETVQFMQPNELSRVLNRITGPDPTLIQGTLLSNGQVYIVNPAGVIFTGTSIIDVGGIYAAAGNITNQHFLNQKDKFTDLQGSVINHGSIRGDQIHLIGKRVENHGVLDAHRGVVTMLAGDTVYIRRLGERISVKIDGKMITDRSRPWAGGTTPDMTASAGVLNTGTIRSTRGQIVLGAGDMYGLAIHNTGEVHAAKGRITVAATDGLIQNDGLLSASPTSGWAGDIVVQGPSILNRGIITADSNNGRAGSVEVTSRYHTYLTNGSRISAAGGDGTARGGRVLVHSYDGLTVLANGAVIDVSGGSDHGRGGFAEVSGYDLTLNGTLRAHGGPGSKHGTIYIDPFNIIINLEGGDDSFLDDGIVTFFEGGDEDAFIAASTLSEVIGLIHLQAQGSIFVEAPIFLNHNNDLLFEAGGIITVREPIVGANSLAFFADVDLDGFGYVSINVPLVVNESIFFSGDHIRMNGGSLVTGTTQDYLADVWFATDYELTGSQINFWNRVDSRFDDPDHSLTIFGDVDFGGAVGSNDPLRFLDITGQTDVRGGLIRTRLGQDYRGAVSLHQTTTFDSLDAGDISFHETLDAAAGGPVNGDGDPNISVHVLTAGTSRFLGAVGFANPLALVRTDAGGTTEIGADMLGFRFDFGDQVALVDDVNINGLIDVQFRDDITGNNHDLRISSPLTRFEGSIHGVDDLETDPFGVTELGGAEIFANRIDFFDVIRLIGDTHVNGSTYAHFARTIDGAFALRVSSDELIVFGDNIGATDALASLRIDAGTADSLNENLVFIHGELIRVDGDIQLNIDGRNAPAHVATFVASRDLTIRSLNGNIEMGQGEKFTVFGDLDLRAMNGVARLSDITTLGNLDVRAGAIEIVSRPGGTIYASDGSIIEDGGVDFVAGGSIYFNHAPVVLGDSADPAFASGNGVNGILASFDTSNISLMISDLFAPKSGIVLDLAAARTAPPPPPPPSVGDDPAPPPIVTARADTLAGTLDDEREAIEDRVFREPVLLQPMERLALFLRGLNSAELLSRTEGVEIVVDLDPSAARNGIAASRLPRRNVVSIVDRYSSIFLIRRDSGELGTESQAPVIRQQLAAAWTAYQASPEAPTQSFREWSAGHDPHAEVVVYLDGLRDLVRELQQAGVTPRELQASVDALCEPLAPDEMGTEELARLIDGSMG